MDEAERLCDRLAIMDDGHIIAEDSPQQLIDRFIEPFVVEIYGERLEGWQNAFVQKLCQRYERAGETLFCYTDDPRPILETLDNETGLRFLSRPANLEDVFLRLTGRDLRE
jgi:lipooligosaccharide transport system ATP-binding protein